MSKVDWSKAPDWADRVLMTKTSVFIFSNGTDFLGSDDIRYGHGEVLYTLTDNHDVLAFEFDSCRLIEMRPDEWKEGEKRMEQIVQNGNDGAVYDELENNKSKYHREIKKGVFVDVYDVLSAFEVVNPAMQHGLKKMLAPGKRGVKDTIQDMKEAIQSIERAIELEREKGE